jgi:hypothetical protein
MGGLPALAVPAEPTACLGPPGFDPGRENLVHRIIIAITTASVPHESPVAGALESRSLGYYLGVGIDHFGHDYARLETLLRKAAEQALAAMPQSGNIAEAAKAVGSVLDDWIRIVVVRNELNPDLRHYVWKRQPTYEEVQNAMQANNKLAKALAQSDSGDTQ